MKNYKKKRILLVGPPSLGYLRKLYENLCSRENVVPHIILIDRYSFKYKSTAHRVCNFFLKILLQKNIKKDYVNNTIKTTVESLPEQDIILIIRPDLLKKSTLKFLKTRTLSLETFYYDSTRRFSEKIEIIPYFDKVYSYDRLDVKQYNLKFLTNYIYSESCETNHNNLFFNISTFDYRYSLIEKIAQYIQSKNWRKEILILGSHDLQSDYLTVIHQQIPVDCVTEKIKNAKIILEVQRTEQIGLSFRAFEALGHRKKFITTNADIVNYDFYHPQNIHIIDEKDINIPDEFVTSPYIPIPDNILDHYRLHNWVNRVFDLPE